LEFPLPSIYFYFELEKYVDTYYGTLKIQRYQRFKKWISDIFRREYIPISRLQLI